MKYFCDGEQMKVMEKLTKFLEDSKRIFVVSKKPTNEEYKRMLIIIGAGAIAVGLIGFLIYLFFALSGIGN